MSLKEFIESYGATCNNWQFSWSFINESEKIVIFSAWDSHTKGDTTLILSENWQTRERIVQKLNQQSLKHIRLIEEEGYRLMTYPAKYSYANKDENGSNLGRIATFTPELREKTLNREGRNWYAIDAKSSRIIPENA